MCPAPLMALVEQPLASPPGSTERCAHRACKLAAVMATERGPGQIGNRAGTHTKTKSKSSPEDTAAALPCCGPAENHCRLACRPSFFHTMQPTKTSQNQNAFAFALAEPVLGEGGPEMSGAWLGSRVAASSNAATWLAMQGDIGHRASKGVAPPSSLSYHSCAVGTLLLAMQV